MTIQERIKKQFPHGKLKESHPYYMYEAIYDISGCLDLCIEEPMINDVKQYMHTIKPEEIFVVGCGTSYNAALAIAKAAGPLMNTPAAAVDSLNFACFPPLKLSDKSLVISISHSGQSLSTCLAQERAKESGAKTIALSAFPKSRLAAEADFRMIDPYGKEIPSGKTRSYISSIFQGLTILASAAPGERQKQFFKTAKILAQTIEEQMPQWEAFAEATAEQWQGAIARYLLGGFDLLEANAVETGLKFLEVTGESAVGYSLEEFAHGPCYSLRKDVGVFLFHCGSTSLERAVEISHAVSTTKASQIVVTDQAEAGWPGNSQVFSIPALEEPAFSVLLSAIPAQLVLYFLALQKGINPDNNNRDLPELQNLPGLLFPPGTH